MAFNTFDEGIAPGGLRSKNEIKILICYLYNTVNDKMSQSLVVEAIRSDELANFFEIVVAFEELITDGNLEKSDVIDGEQTYVITNNGRVIAMQLETTLAHTVKQKSYNCALRLLSERRTARENHVEIRKTKNGFEVDCRVSGGEVTLLEFTLYAPNHEQAEIIKKNFLSYPQAVYKTMLGLMTKDIEHVGEALEEVYGTLV
ncbi:MAG: DUF4364 family protein [Ruminococcus sp.]|nr:DUF4364 family protein [Ruminococcus sp.]